MRGLGVVLILSGLAALIGAGNMFFTPGSLYQGRLAPALLAGCSGWVALLALIFWIWAAARALQR